MSDRTKTAEADAAASKAKLEALLTQQIEGGTQANRLQAFLMRATMDHAFDALNTHFRDMEPIEVLAGIDGWAAGLTDALIKTYLISFVAKRGAPLDAVRRLYVATHTARVKITTRHAASADLAFDKAARQQGFNV